MSNNPVLHLKTKHISIRALLVHGLELELEYKILKILISTIWVYWTGMGIRKKWDPVSLFAPQNKDLVFHQNRWNCPNSHFNSIFIKLSITNYWKTMFCRVRSIDSYLALVLQHHIFGLYTSPLLVHALLVPALLVSAFAHSFSAGMDFSKSFVCMLQCLGRIYFALTWADIANRHCRWIRHCSRCGQVNVAG